MQFIFSSRLISLLFLLLVTCLISCKDGSVTPTSQSIKKTDTCIVIKVTETRTGLSPGTTPMTFEYDAQKRLIKKVYYFENDLSDNSIAFEYDAKDRLIKASSVGIEPNTYTDRYEYNDQGRLAKSIRQYNNYSVTSTMQYDNNGNRIRMDVENSNGHPYYFTYSYADGNLAESRTYSNSSVSVSTYEYYLDKENIVKEELLRVYNLSASNKNLLKKVHTDSPILGDINFSYEFTAKGYLSKVMSQSPAFTTTTVYEYDCN